ncbi:peptidoglycan DD-metalloendopeptidase family protein [Evansella sp. AB-rgal1]|uniref:peptidoglycan DD-metalloendopeptidase family protein n=1 Tax=Evansella sp. AB-rgal1 TaxID=3242696 RepID=UPI00359DE88C
MVRFIRPTTVTRVTSGFRTPSRPNHHGVDFAEPGYHPIFATADGIVSRSYISTSYGEVIMIRHTINGETWESVYAHLRSGSRSVDVGNRVTQGMQIGVMGDTGDATGQHLHFELHRGIWNQNKTNAVNPLHYFEEKEDSTPTSPTLLRKGSIGEIVRQYQNKLLAAGETLPLFGSDGNFGNETETAVKSFQNRRNIQVDGIIGPITRRELDKVMPSYNRLLRVQNPYLSGADVLAVQRVVGVTTDSLYGPRTEQSVRNYQNRYNLNVDGIVGPITWRNMFGS